MIRSMTGYGQGKYENSGREYTVEIKAVNHRYNDVTVKLPRYLSSLEEKIRRYVSNEISRGKIEIYVTYRNTGTQGRNIKVDRSLAGIYIKELKSIAVEYGITDDVTATSIARIPDVFVIDNEDSEELYWTELEIALKQATSAINQAKITEGERLAIDIVKRLDVISGYVSIVEESSKNLLEEYKQKLINRVNELGANNIVDETRIGIEVVMFADKSSICEEVTRLRSHIATLKEMLKVDGAIGKKLDFLVQEMNREANTIGSKANSVGITNYVVEIKNEIENIREQVQNIE